MNKLARTGCLSLLGLLTVAIAPVRADFRYSLVDLGTLGGLHSAAYDVNESGQVVGWAFTASGESHAFLYDYHGATMRDLGAPTGPNSHASGLNASGAVVGNYDLVEPDAYGYRPFVHDGATMRDIGDLGGRWAAATAINDAGLIVGYSQLATGVDVRAFTYDGTTLKDLGTLGGRETLATDVNEHGVVVGYSSTSDGSPIAFIHDGTTMKSLGTLNGWYSRASGINDAGWVVGSSDTAGGFQRAFLHDGSTMHDLGDLGGGWSGASDINNAGQVVGFASAEAGTPMRAFLYSQGAMIDLNDLIDPSLGWTLNYAQAINDSGWIAGYGTSPDGRQRAFLLTPNAAVPEPAGLVMLAIAGATAAVGLGVRKTSQNPTCP